MLGQEAVNFHSDGFQVYSKGQTSDLLTNVSSGTRASRWADSSSDYSYLSFFMRGEYNYKELYYADFSLRTDASSRFGKDHRWGTFSSLGFMYNVKSTDWLKDMKWLSTARIAVSTGTSGNSEIPNYYHLARYRVVPTTIILPVSIHHRVVTRNWVGSQHGQTTSPSVWASSTESTSASRLTTSVPLIC